MGFVDFDLCNQNLFVGHNNVKNVLGHPLEQEKFFLLDETNYGFSDRAVIQCRFYAVIIHCVGGIIVDMGVDNHILLIIDFFIFNADIRSQSQVFIRISATCGLSVLSVKEVSMLSIRSRQFRQPEAVSFC